MVCSALCSLLWSGLVWPGGDLVWSGRVGSGLVVWSGLVWLWSAGLASVWLSGLVWSGGLVKSALLWSGQLCSGLVRPGLVMVWFGLVCPGG